MRRLTGIFFCLFLCLPMKLSGESSAKVEVQNVDTAFQRALKLAFNGERQKATALCDAILERSPNYHGVRVLKGRTYAWDGEYEKARETLRDVLERSPKHADAYRALVDNELWSGNYESALEVVKSALQYHPDDVSLIRRRAKVHYYMGDNELALEILERAQRRAPENSDVRELRARIESDSRYYTLTLSLYRDTFSRIFDPQYGGYVQLSRETPIGSVIGRVRGSRRFETTGILGEIDFYPSLAEGLYAYTSVGVRFSGIYPDYRLGAQLYKSLPWGMEVSLGARYLKFTSDVLILTGTVTKYWGNWMFTVGPTVTPNDLGASISGSASMRYYFGSRDYFAASGSYGIAPNERTYQAVDGEVFLTESWSASGTLQKYLSDRFGVFGTVSLTRREPPFDLGNLYSQIRVSVGSSYDF